MNRSTILKETRRLGREIVCGWTRSDCTTQAAAISFYAALSLFPFVLVMIYGVGLFFEVFESGQSSEKTVLNLLSEVFSPGMSRSVDRILSGIQSQARVNGPIATLVLLYLGSRVFTQIDTAFCHIWDVHGVKRGFRGSVTDWFFSRLRSMAMVAGYAVVGLFVFYGGAALYTAEAFLNTWIPEAESLWGLKSYVLSLATNTLVFGGIYRFLSKGPAGWRCCFGTGLFTAFLWEIGRGVIANLVIGEKYTALGIVGSFLGILLWIFYNILALLLGAVVVRVNAAGGQEGAGGETEQG